MIKDSHTTWTVEMIQDLIQRYPTVANSVLAKEYGKTLSSIKSMARRVGAVKPEYRDRKVCIPGLRPGETPTVTGAVLRRGNVTVHRLL